MDKINQLITTWEKGAVKLSSSLEAKGYKKDLLKKYVNSGWLESLGYGAYKLANDNVDWYGGIFALQTQKESNIHPGGKTALILKGYAHYLSSSLNKADLFGNKSDFLPKWFKDNNWGLATNYIQTKMFNYNNKDYYISILHKDFELLSSSPELAAMEMLYLIPNVQSFDETTKIMEGLATLKPQLVQNLLEECKSIKVKRLFLYMAGKHDHEWLKELNLDKINLGSGKRVIVEGGMLDKKYNITVPKDYAG